MYLVDELLFMQIGPFQGFHSEKARVKVKVHLNLHGIVSVESATVSTKFNNPSKTIQVCQLLRLSHV